MSHWEAVGKSDHWYTPKHVFDAMGNPCFDLDVAAPMLIPAHINARKWLWKDSLETEWSGFVWMNPPYGGRNGIIPWLDKFVAHGNGVALVPDRTSAPWFQSVAQRVDRIFFVTPKIKFLRPNGETGKMPSNGTALLAIREQGIRCLEKAQQNGLGFLTAPIWGYDL